MWQYYKKCRLCPRKCWIDRSLTIGRCGCTDMVRAARAGLHFYEEPFLSGTHGSGTVFFSGCSLGCIYCQNGQISHEYVGVEISIERLAQIFLEQQKRGAHNINIVTGTHFTPSIALALKMAKDQGLQIPVVWNSSGYELPKTLRMMEGLVDIFMPDFKTMSAQLGERYLQAADYPERAMEALACMAEMVGEPLFEASLQVLSDNSANNSTLGNIPGDPKHRLAAHETSHDDEERYDTDSNLLRRGVIVRHLVIPGHTKDSMEVLRYLQETYGSAIWISILRQYTPMGAFAKEGDFACREAYPELCRTLSRREYEKVVDYAISLGVKNCMIQEEGVCTDSFVPDFDGTGI